MNKLKRCEYCKCTIKEDDSHFYCATAYSYGKVEGVCNIIASKILKGEFK